MDHAPERATPRVALSVILVTSHPIKDGHANAGCKMQLSETAVLLCISIGDAL